MNNKDLQKIIDFMKSIGYEINPDMEKYCSFKIEINNCRETSYYFKKLDVESEKSEWMVLW